MAFLYEKIEFLRESGYASDMPSYIQANLNPAFELRPYQIAAYISAVEEEYGILS